MKKILIGITGENIQEVIKKIDDAKNEKIKDIALFLEIIETKEDRIEICSYLKQAGFKNIPLVHIRHDMKARELRLIKDEFKTKYFTIHENCFRSDILKNWRGYYKDLYLELNKDNFISKSVIVEKIGGFCVDLSHFKASEEAWTNEFEYTIKRRDKKLFYCNHLNGYSFTNNSDLHTIGSVKDFAYLRTLPKFVFSRIIALEMFNSVKEQIRFKKYLEKVI